MVAIITTVIHAIMTIMTFPERAPMVTDMQLVLYHINLIYLYLFYVYAYAYDIKALN